MNDDWSQQFNGLLTSPLGEELIRTLTQDLHDNIVRDAEKSVDSQEKAFGLLNQAGGVIKAIEHLQFRAVVPTDEGSKS